MEKQNRKIELLKSLIGKKVDIHFKKGRYFFIEYEGSVMNPVVIDVQYPLLEVEEYVNKDYRIFYDIDSIDKIGIKK